MDVRLDEIRTADNGIWGEQELHQLWNSPYHTGSLLALLLQDPLASTRNMSPIRKNLRWCEWTQHWKWDFTIAILRRLTYNQEALYHGDKGVHFYNNFAVNDFQSSSLGMGSRFSGPYWYQQSFVLSQFERGQNNTTKGQNILVDKKRFSLKDEWLRTLYRENKWKKQLHKANRCGIKNNFQDQKVASCLDGAPWWHPCFFLPIVITIAAHVQNWLWCKQLSAFLLIFNAVDKQVGALFVDTTSGPA